MAKQTGNAKVSEFMGRVLASPLPYSWEFETFGTKADAIAAGKWPSDADEFVLNKVNKASETAARAAAYNEVIKAEREAYEASPEFKLKQLVESILAGNPKLSADAATALAQSIMQQS